MCAGGLPGAGLFYGGGMATVSMKVVIPEGLEFSALKLSRDPVTLDVEFDWGAELRRFVMSRALMWPCLPSRTRTTWRG